MSASDKKKLRKEQVAAALTEKQLQEQREAKKLKTYTIAFVTAIALVVLIAVGVLVSRGITQSGVFEKNTVAANVDGKDLSTVEMNYYFNDAVNNLYSEWYQSYSDSADTYLQYFMGLDVTKPLNEQTNTEEDILWSEYFLNEALEQAKSDYALEALAIAEGHTLTEEEQTSIDNIINNLPTYATLYGYSNADKYLQAMYGYGASVESYEAYCLRSALANSYYNANLESLTYDDSDIRAYEKDKFDDYSTYSYSSCYLSYNNFLEGGTEDEESGDVVYSEAEEQAARDALKTVAEELATATSVEDLEQKIEKVKFPDEETSVSVSTTDRGMHTEIGEVLRNWLSDSARKEGDIAALPSVTGEGDEAVTNGYYVVIFHSRDNNDSYMGTVRHLLVEFEGGTEDEDTGDTVYTDDEKKAAKETAESYLKMYNDGDKTEDAFIELVMEYSADSSAEDGGLFEDVNLDSGLVETFTNWSIDTNRKEGDVEIIESPYGYHVMYFVGFSELTYRDSMIVNEMKTADQEEWYEGVKEPVAAELKDSKYVDLDKIISPSY